MGTRIEATSALPQLIVLFMVGQSLQGQWPRPKVGTPAEVTHQLLERAQVPSLLNAALMSPAFGLGLERAAAALTVPGGVPKPGVGLLLTGPIGAKGVRLATLSSGVVDQEFLCPWAICRRLGLPLQSSWWRASGSLIPPAGGLALELFAWQHLAVEARELLHLFADTTAILPYRLFTLKSFRRGGGRAARAEVPRSWISAS